MRPMLPPLCRFASTTKLAFLFASAGDRALLGIPRATLMPLRVTLSSPLWLSDARAAVCAGCRCLWSSWDQRRLGGSRTPHAYRPRGSRAAPQGAWKPDETCRMASKSAPRSIAGRAAAGLAISRRRELVWASPMLGTGDAQRGDASAGMAAGGSAEMFRNVFCLAPMIRASPPPCCPRSCAAAHVSVNPCDGQMHAHKCTHRHTRQRTSSVCTGPPPPPTSSARPSFPASIPASLTVSLPLPPPLSLCKP